ncbi:DMT family transporter [Candidatus Microgenomates bacterium]|nr:DMT family transporter [Candidatus Microgenomates bacterium]
MNKFLSNKHSAVFLIVILAFIGGGVPAFVKIALQSIPVFTFTFLRFLLAGLVLVPIFLARRELIVKKELKKAILVSLLATANVTLFALGVKKTTATIGQMLYAAVPIFASIFSYFLLKEKIKVKKLAGILLGFIGVLIILILPVLGKSSVFAGTLTGNLLVFIAVASYSLYTVLSKKLQQSFSSLSMTIIFIMTTIFAQSFLLPFELKSNPGFWKNVSIFNLIGLLYVAVLGTSLFYLIYQQAIRKTTPVIVSMVFYLQPIASFLWAFVLLGERLTPGFIIGGVLALVGAGMVTKKD